MTPVDVATYDAVDVVSYDRLLGTGASRFHRGGPMWPDWDEAPFARHWRSDGPFDARPLEPDATTSLTGAHLFWGGAVCRHFGHQVMDFSMRLASSKAADPNARFLFSHLPEGTVPRWFNGLLMWFGIDPAHDVLFVDRPLRVDRLHVTPQAERLERSGPSPAHLDLMDQLVAQKRLGVEAVRGPVYVSRGGRLIGFAGEKYIEAAITAAGGHVFRPENYAIGDQVRLYLSAERLVFAEGSALHLCSLAGRGFPAIDVVLRRKGWRIGEAFLAPRAQSVRYVDTMHGSIHGTKRPGAPWLSRAVTVLDLEATFEYFHAIGLDLRPHWSAQDYTAALSDDIDVWLRRELTPNRLAIEGYTRSVEDSLNASLAPWPAALHRALATFAAITSTDSKV
ncbi:MAG: glycosyltransferase 61 family protein [Pseudomonadota bacterium]